jgi:hypothetical protein
MLNFPAEVRFDSRREGSRVKPSGLLLRTYGVVVASFQSSQLDLLYPREQTVNCESDGIVIP